MAVRWFVGTVVAAFLSAGVAGCGGQGNDGGGGSADVVSCTTVFPTDVISCEEFGGPLPAASVEQYRNFCLTLLTPQEQASFSSGPCSHTGAVGGCRMAQGPASVTQWYYSASGYTEDEVRMGCSGNGAMFIPP